MIASCIHAAKAGSAAATATASRWIVLQSEWLSAGNGRPMMGSQDRAKFSASPPDLYHNSSTFGCAEIQRLQPVPDFAGRDIGLLQQLAHGEEAVELAGKAPIRHGHAGF